MPDIGRIVIIAAAGISGFSLLLLIISVATPIWLDDGNGSTIGLFRKCYGDAATSKGANGSGCYNENRVTQAGLSIFGLLLLIFAIVATIASIFVKKQFVLFAALGLLYFSSMFVMSAYATWGTYTRDPDTYFFPYGTGLYTGISHTSVGASYHLCVAAHYFLWTALTLLALGTGYALGTGRNEG